MIFDRYITVDWSASNRPRTGKDSIWICTLGLDGPPSTMNPRTRGAAEAALHRLLATAVDHRERVLIGFDFPYGYPSGLAGALRLAGPSWLAVWKYLADHLRDSGDTNESNRFEVAAAMNARFPHHAFWGVPKNRLIENLSSYRDQVRYRLEDEEVGLSEWREVELLLRSRGSRPHSTWKLMGVGSVGSQALTGIPVVCRLRLDAELAGVSQVWPFELTVPTLPVGGPAIIHAEIWPTLVDAAPAAGQVKDEAQVIRVAEHLRARDRAGALGPLFSGPPIIAAEEGWILGVSNSSATGRPRNAVDRSLGAPRGNAPQRSTRARMTRAARAGKNRGGEADLRSGTHP